MTARSELRRQLREQRRVRRLALAVTVTLALAAPLVYFGILFATRDPVLNSLDRLPVPAWAAQSPEDRIVTGSRWCIIDCRFRERTLESSGEPAETTEVYQAALREAGWAPWQVEGCPQVEVDGDYSCWTRDEYTLDLWVRPPECAYDPLNLRPDLETEDSEGEDSEGTDPEDEEPEGDPDGDEPGGDSEEQAGDETAEECSGSVVQIKMQNRVSDERGLPGAPGQGPGGPPADSPVGATPTPPASAPPTEPPA
ncbi:hypothetical protein JQS43_12120 [Natronosporangium hydrolyticum]|uniref:Uncharacterized protein n=1 Tax=Natronosporangium hydrolyticum TaxID=2811111 RepID=A0A895YGE3_9ACTN|nr:hypothetical protein [Natronosporangium hydrolyticum]QSB16944.1 hypothetical protein JQS43_12120 [Natronosporangium hydrolyticum]